MNKLILLVVFLMVTVLGQAQTGSEIYLFDLSSKKGSISLSNPVNATNHPGYDNQPFFHIKLPVVYLNDQATAGRGKAIFVLWTSPGRMQINY